MAITDIREQLHKQIDRLPDDVVQQIADFALFVTARRRFSERYADWTDEEWQTFALEQLFSDDDEVEYTLQDAREVYNP